MTLFLDIDGVLNRHKLMDNGYCRMEPECIHYFNVLVTKLPNLEIVLHSSWRYLESPDCMTMLGVENLFLTHGLQVRGRMKYRTESDEDTAKRRGELRKNMTTPENWFTWVQQESAGLRREQIYQYVKEHKVELFVVLDDIELDMPEQLKCDAHVGLTQELAMKAYAIFSDDSQEQIPGSEVLDVFI